MADRHISLDRVLTRAWTRMVQILFRPFSIERWLMLGFCCWMLSLSGDISTILNIGSNALSHDAADTASHAPADKLAALDNVLNGTDGSFLQRLGTELLWEPAAVQGWSLFIGIAAPLIVILLVVCYWLYCRFEFVFLDDLMRDSTEIRKPWNEFRSIGNSYFAGSLLVTAALFLFNLLFFFLAGSVVLDWLKECGAAREWLAFGASRVYSLLFLGGAWFLISLVAGIYIWFFYFLLVPIMYRDRVGFSEGLRRMNALFRRRFWICLLFWLMMLVILFGFGICLLIGYVLTCCLLGFLLGIPYVRAVILLPYWTFLRLSGVELLEELDPLPAGQP